MRHSTAFMQYSFIEAIHLIYATCFAVGIFILQGVVIAEVRRRKMNAFLPWLIPSQCSTGIGLVFYLVSDVRFFLGLRQTISTYIMFVILSMISITLFGWSTLCLWNIIRRLPEVSHESPVDPHLGDSQTWPPSPKQEP